MTRYRKKIYQYTLEGHYVDEYESITEAVRKTGLKSNDKISKSAHTEETQSGGYQWRFYKTQKIPEFVSHNEKLKGQYVGQIFDTNHYGQCKVTSLSHSDKHGNTYYEVAFLDTGFTSVRTIQQIKAGAVRDPMTPTFINMGYLGEDYYNLPKGHTRDINLWNSMLNRCYDEGDVSYVTYGAKGVIVAERWHNFSKFYHDIRLLSGWDEEKFYNGELSLDKDLKQPRVEHKIYSPETCVFMTKGENTRLAHIDRLVEFSALSPNGEYYPHEVNVDEFCVEKGIPKTSISAVYPLISGKSYNNPDSSKCVFGWSFGIPYEEVDVLKERQNTSDKLKKEFVAISPSGERTFEKGISAFAKRKGLHRRHISSCLKGDRNHTGGWRFEEVEEV